MNTPGDSDLHAVDDYGYTPVVLAAASGSRKAFQYLMRYVGDDIQDVAKNPLFQAMKVVHRGSAFPVLAVKVRHQCIISISVSAIL